MKKYSKYVKTIDPKRVKIISTKKVIISYWVRLKCQYGCGGYNKRLTCPPHSPTPDEMKKILSEYKTGLFFWDESPVFINRMVPKLEDKFFFDGFHKAFGLASGPCKLCKICPERCLNTHKARPAMEACGIDVFGTARAHGFPIKPLKTESCKGNYFGLVLIE